jgi:hypothetical protein
MALVMTIVRLSLPFIHAFGLMRDQLSFSSTSTWATGHLIKGKLWESGVIKRHKVFRKDIKEWQELNPVAVTGIRKKAR